MESSPKSAKRRENNKTSKLLRGIDQNEILPA